MKKHVTTTAVWMIGLLLLMASRSLTAETITLNAIEDFPSIEDGEVPYEVNAGTGTLSIDTSVADADNRFARATTSFTGTGGTYDLTLVTLGEAAGESQYRFIVNGITAGVVFNAPLTSDDPGGTEQQHIFSDVFIPAGAILSVESNAVSNGQIPEGDGFALARGQWSGLTLQNDNPAQSIDLSLDAAVPERNLRAGDEFTLAIDITNNSESEAATQPLVFAQVPSTIDFNLPAECTIRSASTTLTCELAEIGPQQTRTINLPGQANATGLINVELSVSADQNDNDLSNNRVLTVLDTRDPDVVSSVDLVLSASASSDTLEIGTSVTYALSATNTHETTIATSPVIDVVLPDNLQFESSSDCTANEQALLCSVAELTPGMIATAQFSVTIIGSGNSELLISTSAAEAEETSGDNELALPVNVLSIAPALEQPEPPAQEQALEANPVAVVGGGGSLSLLLLLPLIAGRFRSALRTRGNIACAGSAAG